MSGVDSVNEALNLETFSFADVIQGRGYPTDVVPLCTDEATAYERGKYLDDVLEARGDTAHLMYVGDKREAEKLKAYKRAIEDDPEVAKKVAEFDKILAASTYQFHIRGVDTETIENLRKQAIAEFPPKFKRWKNPVDGRPMEEEEEEPERQTYFTNLLWAAHVAQIVDPQGRKDTAPGYEGALAARRMPLSQQQKLMAAISRLTVDSAAFEANITPDFSQAS